MKLLATRPAESRLRDGVVLLLLTVTAVGGAALGLAWGAGGWSWSALLAIAAGTADDGPRLLIVDLRLPRVLGASVAGALLAVAGVLFQAVTRNPLAEPSTLGVTPAAAAAVAVLLAVDGPQSASSTAVAAGLGALGGAVVLAALALIFGMHSRTLILLGIAAATSFQALTALALVLGSASAQSTLVWLIGSLGRTDLSRAAAAGVIAVPLLVAVVATARVCDLLEVDDDSCRALGLRLWAARAAVLALATAATAVAVAVAGALVFVGLVVPHILRRLLHHSRHAVLMPACAIGGAALVLLADVAGRVVLAPVELAAGVVVGVVGAPVFLLLLRRRST